MHQYLESENLLGNEQAGFRPAHSTLDHIYSLNFLINYYLQKRKKVFCAFVDYSKAFDLVNRSFLWNKLVATQINGKVIKIIKNIYNHAKSMVCYNGELSSPFYCQAGLRQGENLSSVLFAIFLNDFRSFIAEKYTGLVHIGNELLAELDTFLYIFCLLYADDTLLLAETADELQDALNALYAYCKKWGLKVNLDKTKVVVFSRGKVRKYKCFYYGNDIIDVIYDYLYLGVIFNFNNKFNKTKDRQKTLGLRATFGLISKIKKLNLPMSIVTQIIESCIVPVLFYGSEVWGYGQTNDMQICFNKIMRYILGLNKSTPKCMLYGELGLKSSEEIINNKMLNFWFNIVKSNDNKFSKIIYKFSKHLFDLNIFKCPWLTHIKSQLDLCGLTYLFDDNENVSKNMFKNLVKLRLNDI